jgi:CheY-like chemotaxis protein
VRENLEEAIAATKALSIELAPPVLREKGLAAALEWLASWMQATHDLTVQLRLDPSGNPWAWSVRVLIFESVRELLFNVVKHAGVKEATLEFGPAPNDGFRVVVSHQGIGFDVARVDDSHSVAGGLGLLSIRERVALLGGSFEMDSAVTGGARFTIVGAKSATLPDSNMAGRTIREGVEDQSGAGESLGSDGRLTLLLVGDVAADDAGMSAIVAQHREFEFVGAVTDPDVAAERMRTVRPDVVIVGGSTPDLSSHEVIRRLRDARPDSRVISLTGYDDAARVEGLLSADAATDAVGGHGLGVLLTKIRVAYAGSRAKRGQPLPEPEVVRQIPPSPR